MKTIKHAIILKLYQEDNDKEDKGFYNEYTKNWVKDIAKQRNDDLLCSVQNNDNKYEIVTDKQWDHILVADIEYENGLLDRLKINQI